MALWNTERAWGWPATRLHWLMALLVLALLALGLVMVDIEDLRRQFQLYQLHKSLGLLALAAVVVRLVWRAANRAPDLPPGTRPWEAVLARATHAAIYVLLLALPASGFLMAASSPLAVPTEIFGILPVPHPIGPDEAVHRTLRSVHDLLGKLLMVLLLLHVAGALRHHLVLRDEVLLRMLPGLPRRSGTGR